MTLHLSQIFFTDARTFMTAPNPSWLLLVPVDDPAARQIVRAELHRYAITGKNADEIFPHAARYMRQHLVLVLELYLEHGVRQGLNNRCHYFNRVFLRQTLSRFRRFCAGSTQSAYCVKIVAPSAVTATVCSKCALKLPSCVTAVQPSLNT